MNKKIIIAASVLATICAAGIIIWLIFTNSRINSPHAEIYVDGSLYKICDLSTDEKFTVETQHGFNSISVLDGAISFCDADCPDRVCIRTGAISGGAVPIICLPHRLEIRIVSGEDSIDGQIR